MSRYRRHALYYAAAWSAGAYAVATFVGLDVNAAHWGPVARFLVGSLTLFAWVVALSVEP